MRRQTENVGPGFTTTNLAVLVKGSPEEPSGSVQGVMKTLAILKKLGGFLTSSNSTFVSGARGSKQLTYRTHLFVLKEWRL
jgi:hypothetical protein